LFISLIFNVLVIKITLPDFTIFQSRAILRFHQHDIRVKCAA